MIRVENLTKYYGETVGVRDLNFQVETGEVLGFLGPNGAGKTTTMKMLTCYLPPSAGTAKVSGFDIIEQSMEVRKRIGYLPERNPLYTEMSVRAYLGFVARVKGIRPPAQRGQIDGVIERCGLETVHRRTIEKLSKGYQQRVGIAQAILGDPEILILDEPTLGLDPKQIIEIRQLIRNLGGEKTVVLSSHILPEVSQVCNRVIIINHGELIAVDTPDNLRSRLAKAAILRLAFRDEGDAAARASRILESIKGVLIVRQEPGGDNARIFTVECAPDRDIREEIARALVGERIPLLELYREELSLEDIFLQLVTEEVS
ncbi:MAG: ATP-binding cassette domain-containing protein [Candidatus Krumholzibacteria bacterium]|nr:ATP-binding cassette domain-containing protein [Candidatus Krumholzibacteria bacterium]